CFPGEERLQSRLGLLQLAQRALGPCQEWRQCQVIALSMRRIWEKRRKAELRGLRVTSQQIGLRQRAYRKRKNKVSAHFLDTLNRLLEQPPPFLLTPLHQGKPARDDRHGH